MKRIPLKLCRRADFYSVFQSRGLYEKSTLSTYHLAWTCQWNQRANEEKDGQTTFMTPVKHGKAQARYRRSWMCFIKGICKKIVVVTWKDQVTNTEVLK